MSRKDLRILSRVGLLLVVFGFFMPITCDLNGFEMISYMEKLGDSSESQLAVMMLYVLFFAAVIGIFSLIDILRVKSNNMVAKKQFNKMSMTMEWISLGGSILGGLIAYAQLKELFRFQAAFNDSGIQAGGYCIIAGWITSAITLFMASVKPDDSESEDAASLKADINYYESFNPTHKVKILTDADALGVRRIPQQSSAPLFSIKNDTLVNCLKVGENGTLHGVTAPWVFIKTKDGREGWCFSGSLEKLEN